METIKFKIRIKKELPINLSIKEIRKYPINKHKLFEVTSKHLVYKYNPASNLNKNDYLKVLMKSIIEQFENENTNCKIEIVK